MKVKIETCSLYDDRKFVWVHTKPGENGVYVCRKYMARLLRGTGKRLPKHWTDEVIEIQLTAK